LKRRVALVTGGTVGIGAATTEALLVAGYHVAANYGSNQQAAEAFTARTGITLSINGGKYLA
jgi:acetoacetyl-CoA reductase